MSITAINEFETDDDLVEFPIDFINIEKSTKKIGVRFLNGVIEEFDNSIDYVDSYFPVGVGCEKDILINLLIAGAKQEGELTVFKKDGIYIGAIIFYNRNKI